MPTAPQPPSRARGSILDAAGSLLRPSLQHRVVVAFIQRFMRASSDPASLGDLETLQARWLAKNEREPRKVPSDFVDSPLSSAHVRVLEYLPTLATPRRTLVHLHGGAYTKPADPRQFAFVRRIADALGARVLMPLYALAPEHTWEDSRSELVDLVSRVAEESPEGVVLSGDSAGGGYALSVAQGVRDAGGTTPTQLVLVAPWVDLRRDVPGREAAAAHDPWLTMPLMHVYAGWWAGSEEDRDRPEVSPGLGDLTGLPPTLAFCGTRDMLHAENIALADRAAEAGWDYELVVGRGLIHVYPILPVPEANVAIDRIIDFLRSAS